MLTGESMPVAKSVAAVTGREPQDQPGCAFMGTIAHEGSGLGVVVWTGRTCAMSDDTPPGFAGGRTGRA